jgi:hypothetical protein
VSKIKEQLIGYDREDEWLNDSSYQMVNEMVEYRLYCMTVLEMQTMAADWLRNEYHAMPYGDFEQKYLDVLKDNRDE